jgi:hypothetical protein
MRNLFLLPITLSLYPSDEGGIPLSHPKTKKFINAFTPNLFGMKINYQKNSGI